MNKEEFAKIRIAIVSDVVYKKPEYLDDDGKLTFYFLVSYRIQLCGQNLTLF